MRTLLTSLLCAAAVSAQSSAPLAFEVASVKVAQPQGDGVMHASINSASMSQFSDMLGRWTDRPVIDKTGIADKFDVKLDLSMEELSRSRSANVVVIGGPSGAGSSGSAPDGGPTGSL